MEKVILFCRITISFNVNFYMTQINIFSTDEYNT